MESNRSLLKLLVFKIFILFSVPAFSQSFYVSGSIGQNYQDDTSNNGTFTSAFTTGAVTGATPPLTIPAGSAVSWNTNYNNGDAINFAVGMTRDNYRFELEYSQTQADVDSHQGVTAAGIDLSTIDAGILISGNVGDLGVSTAALVAAGQGELETSTLMLNAYYDYKTNSAFTPYVGIGLGTATTDLEFSPSAVGVISDDDNTFVYQLILGASYTFTENLGAFASYIYRDADEASLNGTLLPARFEINNESSLLNVGLKFSF